VIRESPCNMGVKQVISSLKLSKKVIIYNFMLYDISILLIELIPDSPCQILKATLLLRRIYRTYHHIGSVKFI